METDTYEENTTENPVADDSEPVEAPAEPAQNLVSVDDLLPVLQESAAQNNDGLTQTILEVTDRPFMTTNFEDYSVTEGLLLLIAVLLILNFFLALLRRWF